METVFKAINHKKTGGQELQEATLPAFKSEKTVRAAKILAIQYEVERGTYRLALDGGVHVDVTKVWVNKRSPHVGGYFVQYEDGYSSFSPAQAFEQGYVPLASDELPVASAPDAGSDADPAVAAKTETETKDDEEQPGAARRRRLFDFIAAGKQMQAGLHAGGYLAAATAEADQPVEEAQANEAPQSDALQEEPVQSDKEATPADTQPA